ncbi:MAG: hypothetical protein IKO61_12605 [Lachnospiraceae bacterium]|nr:hypothetical protein [Lachnospiraceae bacterium]
MKFLYKLEEKWGSKSVKNLPLITVIVFSLSYILFWLVPDVYEMLVFDPFKVFGSGQVWRVFTWIFTMPGSFNYFTLVMLFVYVMLGRSIEMSIGTFMYNIYVFSMLIVLMLGNVITGLIFYLQATGGSMGIDKAWIQEAMYYVPEFGPTVYILDAIFLGFALIYSESFMLFMFVIPIRAKYLAYADLIWLGYLFFKYNALCNRVNIICVVVVWLVYTILMKHYTPGHAKVMLQRKAYTAKRTMERKKREHDAEKGKIIDFPGSVTRHKCAICGKTEKDDPMMEFRFCSKCDGNYEYCSEHLYTHTHVKLTDNKM